MEPTGNRLLDTLPEVALTKLNRRLKHVRLDVPTILAEPGRPIQHVYFPLGGVVSLVTPLEGGSIVEVATIGNEGIVGVPFALGGAITTVRAIVQVSGTALRMTASDFVAELSRPEPLAQVVENYLPALFSQIAQAAGCNRLHSNEERLSRWLLMSHDRVGQDHFDITQEFLAQMLGSRRATVTVSAGILQQAGFISYSRGHMVIRDREGLLGASCECYHVIKEALDRVVAGNAVKPFPISRSRRGSGH
ncbi:MAG: Crp/Fnr family transcriptional regulator [Candidatus Dormibacteria bacterium]